jgi:hypothetical protein
VINLLDKILRRADDDVKLTAVKILQGTLTMGPNYHYEVSNRHLLMISKELLRFRNTSKTLIEENRATLDSILDHLSLIIQFKMQNGMLNPNTYAQIVNQEARTVPDHLAVNIMSKEGLYFMLTHEFPSEAVTIESLSKVIAE